MSEVTRLEEAVAHLVPRARQGDAAARDELLAQGVVLKDSPSGTTWEAAS